MRHYVRSSLGVDAPVPVPANEQPQNIEPVNQINRDYTVQTFAIMGVAALPWVPVAAGAWIGDKYDHKGWGALAGLAVSFLVVRQLVRGI